MGTLTFALLLISIMIVAYFVVDSKITKEKKTEEGTERLKGFLDEEHLSKSLIELAHQLMSKWKEGLKKTGFLNRCQKIEPKVELAQGEWGKVDQDIIRGIVFLYFTYTKAEKGAGEEKILVKINFNLPLKELKKKIGKMNTSTMFYSRLQDSVEFEKTTTENANDTK